MTNRTPRTQKVVDQLADNPKNLQPVFDLCRLLECELEAFKKNNEEIIQSCNAAIASWDEERERALREATRVKEWREKYEVIEAELDIWASRCAAAIWLLPETVTGGQLREAQDKFYRQLETLRRENEHLRREISTLRLGSGKTTITYTSIKVGLLDKPNIVRRFLAWAILGLRWEDAARKEAQP